MQKYNIEDAIGKKFGLLSLVNTEPIKLKQLVYLWKCDCGNTRYIPLNSVMCGHNTSCGECEYGRRYAHRNSVRHNLARHPLYKTWNNIIQRCGKHKNYVNISVCDEWKSDFVNFYDWAINNGYEKGLTIDRIDSSGNYCPENCRWITQTEQTRNTSRNRNITINGVTKCMTDWCKVYNINRGTLQKRLLLGWNEIYALTTPVNTKFSTKKHNKIWE